MTTEPVDWEKRYHEQKAELEASKKEIEHLNKEWRGLENGYVLPMFEWAKEMGVDLSQLVSDNPSHNCNELFVRELRKRIEKLEAVLVLSKGGTASYKKGLDKIAKALGDDDMHLDVMVEVIEELKRTIELHELALQHVAEALGSKDMPVNDFPDAIQESRKKAEEFLAETQSMLEEKKAELSEAIKKRDGWKARMGELLEQSPDESERQLMLLALAKLSLERPGFDAVLNKFALKYDNGEERAEMYDQFRKMHKSDRTPEQWSALLRACVQLQRAMKDPVNGALLVAQSAVVQVLKDSENA